MAWRWRPGGDGAHVDALLAVAVARRIDRTAIVVSTIDRSAMRNDAHTQEVEEQGAAEPQQERGKYRQPRIIPQ